MTEIIKYPDEKTALDKIAEVDLRFGFPKKGFNAATGLEVDIWTMTYNAPHPTSRGTEVEVVWQDEALVLEKSPGVKLIDFDPVTKDAR
jgi:hypothetical protein